jgi:hypothetical protein
MNVHRYSFKIPGIFANFNNTLILSTDFREMPKCQISCNSVHCEPRCFIQTERHNEANNRFPQFCERA